MAPKGPIQPKGMPLAAWANTEQVLAQHMAVIVAVFRKELVAQWGIVTDLDVPGVNALTAQYAAHLLARQKDFSLILVPPAVPPTGEAS